MTWNNHHLRIQAELLTELKWGKGTDRLGWMTFDFQPHEILPK